MKLLVAIAGVCLFPLILARSTQERPDDVLDAGRLTEGPIDGMYNFTQDSFYRDTMKGYAFVMYFRGRGNFINKVEPTWKKVAKHFEDNKNVKIGQINCDAKDNLICTEQGILGYPIIKYYKEGNEIESHYISTNGDELIAYVQKNLDSPPADVKDNVVQLTNETFKDVISKGITFLKFFDPRCGFCHRIERIWKQLSNEEFEGVNAPVKIAALNCKLYEQTCVDNGCHGFPTILLFIDGEAVAEFYDPRTLASFKEFIIQEVNGYQPKDQRSRYLHVYKQDVDRDYSFQGL